MDVRDVADAPVLMRRSARRPSFLRRLALLAEDVLGTDAAAPCAVLLRTERVEARRESRVRCVALGPIGARAILSAWVPC